MKKQVFVLGLLISSLPNLAFAKDYKDINNHWANPYIKEIDQMQLINGYQDDSFRPDENLKKSHIYKIVNRIFYFTEKDQEAFKNLPKDLWYLDELKIAAQAAYIEAADDFADQDITRLEFINILGSLYGLDKENTDYTYFIDIDNLNEKSKIYLGNLLKDGVISGFTDFEFKPDKTMTRAEASKIISLSIKKYGRDAKVYKENLEKEKIIDEEYEKLKKDLEEAIKEAEKLDTKRFSPDSIIELNSKVLAGKQISNNNNLNENPSKYIDKEEINFRIKKAIEEIEEAKRSLVYQTSDARLYIKSFDAKGNSLEAEYTINKKPFKSGDPLAPGDYLLEARSKTNKQTSSYIHIGNEDKTITINFDEDDYLGDKNLSLKIGSNLSSPQGFIFKKNDRVEIQIEEPFGKEIDYLLINGKKKEVLSETFIFLIKEDTEVRAVFKDKI